MDNKKRQSQLRVIKVLLIILSVPALPLILTPVFTYIAQHNVQEYYDNGNLLISYIVSLLSYLTNNIYFPLGLVTLLGISLYIIVRKIKTAESKRREFLKLFILFGFLGIAYPTMIFVAMIASQTPLEMNAVNVVDSIVFEINAKPKEELASFDLQSFENYIDNTELPEIKFNDADFSKNVVFEEINQNSEFGGFFKKYIEKTYDGYSIPGITFSNEKTFLYNDTLYINDFAPEFKTLYQKVGKYFVEDYIRERNTEYPEVLVVTRDEYIALREGEIDELIKEYDEYIQTLRESIELAKQWIAEDERYAQIYGGEWWTWVEQDKEWLAYYEDSLAEWEEWRTRIAGRKIDALTELGRFNPPSEIDIVLAEYEYYPADQYLGTLVHEYFHYISNYDEAFLHDFWEESITEYYTEKVAMDKLGYNNHYSYSNIVPIMEEIIKDVGEEKILDIYFSKDQEATIQLLNETYGENFWQNYESMLYHATYMYDEESEAIVEEVMGIIE